MIDFNQILEAVANDLDIPDSKRSLAEQRYNAVGTWLSDGYFPNLKPQIYVQGSFLLGTVIRPYKNQKDAEYDIDLVCQIPYMTEKTSTAAKELKHSIGNRLKAHAKYKEMLDQEGRRCWTLDYSRDNDVAFHLDILPSVLDPYGTKEATRLAITTKDKEENSYTWNSTNPKAFAEWFKQQSWTMLTEARSFSASDNIEDVPNFSQKNTLQRIVQILKRHRDIRFDGKSNADDAPISMIITVLAAYLYNHNANLFHALADITKKLTAYSQLLTERYDVLALSESTRDYHIISRTPDGIWHLNNPVADENFAERWHENGNRKAKAFFQWSNWIYEDIVRPIENGNVASFYNTCRMLIPDLESRLNSFPSTIQQALQRNIQYIRALPPRSFFFQRQRKELIYPIVLDTDCRVKVECLATKSGWRSINYCNNGSPLPKGYSLKFTAQTNVKHPDCVLWQVVNTGEEAEKAHCLRGDFYNNETVDAYTGGYVRKESTSYTGKHWIECFIIKNQKCVARSGEFVVNIQ